MWQICFDLLFNCFNNWIFKIKIEKFISVCNGLCFGVMWVAYVELSSQKRKTTQGLGLFLSVLHLLRSLCAAHMLIICLWQNVKRSRVNSRKRILKIAIVSPLVFVRVKARSVNARHASPTERSKHTPQLRKPRIVLSTPTEIKVRSSRLPTVR